MILRRLASAVLVLTGAACTGPGAVDDLRPLVVATGEIEVLAPETGFTAARRVVRSGPSLWVLDAAPPFLTRVELETRRAATFAPRGEGPGELLNPLVLVAPADPAAGGVQVWDYGRGTVVTFDAEGRVVASEPVVPDGLVSVRWSFDEVSFADPLRMGRDGAGLLGTHFPGRVDRATDLLGGVLRRMDAGLSPGAELVRFVDHSSRSSDELTVWGPVPLWDACAGSLVLWSPDSSRVLWLDPGGRPTHSVAVGLEAGAVEDADIQRYLRQMARLELGPDYERAGIDFAGMARARRESFPRRRPLATDVRCEAADVAWLRMFDTEADPVGRSRVWLRVQADGLYEAVQFPGGFTPALFTPDGVVGTLQVDTGPQQLARWTPPWSGTRAPTQHPPRSSRRAPHASFRRRRAHRPQRPPGRRALGGTGANADLPPHTPRLLPTRQRRRPYRILLRRLLLADTRLFIARGVPDDRDRGALVLIGGV